MATRGSGSISIMTPSMAWLVICFLVLPITVVFAVSVTDRPYLSLPHEGLSLQYYRNLLTAPWLSSILRSLVVAVASTPIAGIAATLGAIACLRATRPAQP